MFSIVVAIVVSLTLYYQVVCNICCNVFFNKKKIIFFFLFWLQHETKYFQKSVYMYGCLSVCQSIYLSYVSYQHFHMPEHQKRFSFYNFLLFFSSYILILLHGFLDFLSFFHIFAKLYLIKIKIKS